MIIKPEILCHPHIPKPLHSISPRTIMGQEWWNVERKKVYASTDYHCIACGVHKSQAKKHQWLEAHEFWDIDYKTGICKILSIEPLCHYCHNFIHSGRLSMIMGKEKTEQEVIDILEHGFRVLSEHKLNCFPYTLSLAKSLGCKTFGVKMYKSPKECASWDKFILIWQDKEYKSKFANFEEWRDAYNN